MNNHHLFAAVPRLMCSVRLRCRALSLLPVFCLLLPVANATAGSVDLLIVLDSDGNGYTLQQTVSPAADKPESDEKASASISLNANISEPEIIFLGPDRQHYSSQYQHDSGSVRSLTIHSGSVIVRYQHALPGNTDSEHGGLFEFLLSSIAMDVSFSAASQVNYSATVVLPENFEFAADDTTGAVIAAAKQQRRSISLRASAQQALRMPVRFRRIDRDQDGVGDSSDLCPDSAEAALVDRNGCVADSDSDGISDIVDSCPGSRYDAAVDTQGCETDSDNDGLADRYDQCDNTPENYPVAENGCSLDSDADGIADGEDQCPDSEIDEPVSSDGCSLDFDKDGVPNFRDHCSSTAYGRTVNSFGCETDSDADGVADRLDVCPDSPANIEIDSSGCALDTDGDKVPDYRDLCLTESDQAADRYGCAPSAPEQNSSQTNEEQAAQYARTLVLEGVQFPTASAFLSAQSRRMLNRVARAIDFLQPSVFEIATHTDDSGDAEFNLQLSQRRAESIRQYLMIRGVSPNVIVARGYGESAPLLDNSSEENREANRRAELRDIRK